MVNRKKHIFLYGPPGSGKTTVGKVLAHTLGLPFVDLDAQIEAAEGRTITSIMQNQGEAVFRTLESAKLEQATRQESSIISLGGGALLSEANRKCAESAGEVVILEADLNTLITRLTSGGDTRPLLAGDLTNRLNALMQKRGAHYNSFSLRVANYPQSPSETAERIQALLGRFRVHQQGIDYDVIIQRGAIKGFSEFLKDWQIPSLVTIVTDSNVGALYAEEVQESLKEIGQAISIITIPAGEGNKSLETVSFLWQEFVKNGLDRKSLAIALGGGVTGDLTGFAASTYMRGIPWVGIPTSLLAMVDSSLGGKTGFDLPYGKNLVGAFHSPRLVLTDPDLLSTLPQEEFRSGLAEVMKHGVIADSRLFEIGSNGEKAVAISLDEVIRRAIAVKVQFIESDPFEHGARAALNFGHTVGHAVELVSGFRLRHGEAVAIGMVAEARLAEKLSLAERGLAKEISRVLAGLGLPTEIPPEFPREAIVRSMQVDKKKQAGKVRFALPLRIGEVKTGVEIDDLDLIFTEG